MQRILKGCDRLEGQNARVSFRGYEYFYIFIDTYRYYRICDDMKNKIATKRNINYIILHHFFHQGGLRYPFQA